MAEHYAVKLLDHRLEPTLKELYETHRKRAAQIDWSYHEFLPWDKGRCFKREPWDISQRTLSDEVYTAIETALLTEVNLPWFTTYLAVTFKGSLEVLTQFVHTWTAEEDQHSSLLETYLLLTRNADPDTLHRLRKLVVEQGFEPDFDSALETMVYTTVQELATMVFYNNVAKAATPYDPDLSRLLRRLAKDETLHFAFYRDAVKAYLAIDHNYVYYIERVMTDFKMPGSSMPDFDQRMNTIATHANYGPIAYFNQVYEYLIHYWGIDSLQPSRTEAVESKVRLLKHYEKMKRVTERLAARGLS
ncbi:acyl-ACP desaturase [Brevibacillus humidisoli]|uniref:acyl-ACP desaturase n=1 Tax=Brevibacillus humidisoli TaxID=2895522 RepID=UPI001E4817F4|nr:acyl-ACP desaturase [Brevibacillus humidisoli]UFJ42269.1 acyl-ACP desaturase [Brevibacillus humidisoli]